MIGMVDRRLGGVYNGLMPTLKDETGNRYGKLVVIEKVAARDKSGAWWRLG